MEKCCEHERKDFEAFTLCRWNNRLLGIVHLDPLTRMECNIFQLTLFKARKYIMINLTNDSKPSTTAWEFSLWGHCLGQVYIPNKKETLFHLTASISPLKFHKNFLLFLLLPLFPLLFESVSPLTPTTFFFLLQSGHFLHKCSLTQGEVGLSLS